GGTPRSRPRRRRAYASRARQRADSRARDTRHRRGRCDRRRRRRRHRVRSGETWRASRGESGARRPECTIRRLFEPSLTRKLPAERIGRRGDDMGSDSRDHAADFAPRIREDFVDTIGNTPLIKLRKASELTGCTILGKAEFLNPGGSVKDRAAKYIVLDAERRKVIEPGGLIVEGTAGNTGIGLALVGNSRGYRTLILMPNTQSQEKKDALRLCGAELREVPAV